MRAVVQRVLSASVVVEGTVVGRIGPGLLVLVGAHKDDTESNAFKLANRIAGLRIFNDDAGKMNLSMADAGAMSVLAVSNFTVYGDAIASRRPSFISAAPFEQGRELFEAFVKALEVEGIQVETGKFGADMKVSLVNDGPVTLVIDC